MSEEQEQEQKVEALAFKFYLERMFPSARDCDPRAYFRAKLAGLRQSRKIILKDEEYATERQEVFDMLVLPARYPPSFLPMVVVSVICGGSAALYGLVAARWGWIAGAISVASFALWALQGFRKHHAWLDSISKSDRVETIRYLHDSKLVDDNEAVALMARLDSEFTSAR